MSNDSTSKTLLVALGVCLVCSVLVATAAVTLKPMQEANRERDKLRNILLAGNLYEKGMDTKRLYAERIRSRLVELESGRILPESEHTNALNPETFDIQAVSKDPDLSNTISRDADPADIDRLPRYMPVFEVTDGDSVTQLILPVYGKGLWSTLYGFVALDRDLRTIRGFTFYEHGETPGLGGEVDNPNWKRLWIGKQAFDADGALRIRVVKGSVAPDDPDARYKVDGLSGSTLTTRGVDNLVRFWLGEGYRPFLDRLAASPDVSP
ncbi:MAG TPA: Na(+)-translocating NADH-quinone reductase subunit C [bacterium]|nr:Na(+)-translocating NADH-quinone reductase subunit C [bacterium]